VTPRIAVLKPDYGFKGGFEHLVDQLLARLTQRGHDLDLVTFDAATRRAMAYELYVPDDLFVAHGEYFRYVNLVEQVQGFDLSGYDVVVSTQPPTFLVDHPRVLALFYHHIRVFYDLAEEFERSRFVHPDVHRAAVDAVRGIDATRAGEIRHFLAGSETIAGRLGRFWDVPDERISPYRAPVMQPPVDPPPRRPDGDVLCVSRHEWPKRTELMVAALHALDGGPHGHLVGGGSRMHLVRVIDAHLRRHRDLLEVDPGTLWLNPGHLLTGPKLKDGPPSDRLTLHGTVTDAERDRLYANAAVVVAPAYQEDYGLTPLEAFAWGRPVVVCEDGGGLRELVQHEENGLVVAPTPQGIAAGIRRVLDDRDLADHLVEGGRRTYQAFTWDRALDQFEVGLRHVLEG
jgi:glycosyltransferase involved in cell wall biosynthesis